VLHCVPTVARLRKIPLAPRTTESHRVSASFDLAAMGAEE
jgi:hypothetical protein